MQISEDLTSVQDDPALDDAQSVEYDESLDEPAASAHTEVHPEVDRDVELQALKEAAKVLREDPDVSALLRVVRSTPDIFTEIQPVLARRDELAEAALPGETHRTFAPLFIGMSLSARAKEILNLAVDRNTVRETTWMLEQIRGGCTYVPEVVIGSGVHAAIFNAERIANDPDNPSVTVDNSPRIGGQFAQPESPVWFLNTRTRPETPNAPHVPGAEGSLNTLGGGVLQQSDLSGEAFGSQDTLSLPTRVNHLLFSKILSSTEVVAIEHNLESSTADSDESATQSPRYVVTLKYLETGEIFTIQTDRVILASGLGEPITGFETSDQATQELIQAEAETHARGEDAKIMTFEQFAARVGEESNPFPLRDFKRVAIIGPGDGGAVAAEYLLGHGPSTRMSVAQLDRIEKLVWLGQKAQTREEYLFAARQRYRDLALEFPVETGDDYVHRIEPIAARAFRLERLESGEVRIHYGIKNEDGTITPTGAVDVDHIILATGFKDTTDMVCEKICIDDEEKTEFVMGSSGEPVARRYKGTEVYKVGPAAKLPVSTQDTSRSPAMRRGKDIKDTVAVWASAEETESFARQLPEIKYEDQPENFVTHEPQYTEVALPSLEGLVFSEAAGPIEVVASHEAIKLLKPSSVSEDIIRFVVESKFGDIRFPKSITDITFEVTRGEGASSSEVPLRASTIQGLEKNDVYRDVLTYLLSDELSTAVLARLTHSAYGGTVKLSIPIVHGKAMISDITVQTR